MNSDAPQRSKRRHAWGAWLALWLLLWQTAASAGLIQRPMSPVETVDGASVICTEHGMQSLPGSDAPGHAPSDHSGPNCPCCMPFSSGAGGAILASAVALPVPAWSGVPLVTAPASAPLPSNASASPQQPRAPPISI